jgi:hypothetical protein
MQLLDGLLDLLAAIGTKHPAIELMILRRRGLLARTACGTRVSTRVLSPLELQHTIVVYQPNKICGRLPIGPLTVYDSF